MAMKFQVKLVNIDEKSAKKGLYLKSLKKGILFNTLYIRKKNIAWVNTSLAVYYTMTNEIKDNNN